MSQHFLNKYEKEQRIIELHLQNKTIREIAKEVHMTFSPISKIIKAFERKARPSGGTRCYIVALIILANPCNSWQKVGPRITRVCTD